jgi:hypothetical protein
VINEKQAWVGKAFRSQGRSDICERGGRRKQDWAGRALDYGVSLRKSELAQQKVLAQ